MCKHEIESLVSLCSWIHVHNGGFDKNPIIKVKILYMEIYLYSNKCYKRNHQEWPQDMPMNELETKPLVSLYFGVHVCNGGVDENPTIKINLLNMK